MTHGKWSCLTSLMTWVQSLKPTEEENWLPETVFWLTSTLRHVRRHTTRMYVHTNSHTHMHTSACTNVTNEKTIVCLITWIPFLQRWSTCPNCVEGGSFTVLTQYYQPRKLTLGWQRPASGIPASILPAYSLRPHFSLHWRHYSLVILSLSLLRETSWDGQILSSGVSLKINYSKVCLFSFLIFPHANGEEKSSCD